MEELIITAVWVAAFISVTCAIGKYLAGVAEFKSWKWPCGK